MFALEDFKGLTEEQNMKICFILKGQLLGEKDVIANLSNASA
ncbi:diguanylate cyclase, partial [Clostridium botulinum]